jgi:alkylhydroperoxidase family enzyme
MSGQMTDWTRFGREDVRAIAPAAVDAFRDLIAAVGAADDAAGLEVVRRRIAMVLSVPSDVLPVLAPPPPAKLADLAAWPTSPAFDDVDRVRLEFAEQFVIDVAAVSATDRQRLSDALGAATFPFVQSVYVLDHVARLSAVIRQIFGASPLDAELPGESRELWPAMECMMAAVMTIGGLDPLTAELVRLRGARVHNCRVCQSRRRVAAVVDDATLLEDPHAVDAAGLDDAQRAALHLTDAILLNPGTIPAAVTNAVTTYLTPQHALEVAMLVAHNAANKIAVALAADAPTVTQGVEFFEVDTAGGYEYGLPSPL